MQRVYAKSLCFVWWLHRYKQLSNLPNCIQDLYFSLWIRPQFFDSPKNSDCVPLATIRKYNREGETLTIATKHTNYLKEVQDFHKDHKTYLELT